MPRRAARARLRLPAAARAPLSLPPVHSKCSAAADAPAADAATLKEIANYKNWTRVTEKPVPGGNLFAGG